MERIARPRLELLTEAEASRIVEEACRVLETIGVAVENEEGRRLLDEASAERAGERHRIPERLVREAISSAPRRFVIHDRDGNPAMRLGDDEVHFDPGSAAIQILDAGSWTRRDATSRDVVEMIRLVEGLPHYAAQATALTPGDIPVEIADRYRLYLSLRHSRKPIVTGIFRSDGMAPMLEMLVAIRGGEKALAERPLAIFDCCPSPPLKWSDLTCHSLIECARAGLPAELVSMPLAGATAPVTLREAVVQHCAENLSGIVIHQLAGRGSPIVYGGAPAAFDMRRGTTPMGAIETMMLTAAYAEVGKRIGLPTHGYLALSDAKTPDYQAGMESGIGALIAALAGINVVSGPGMLDYLLTQSPEKLLLDHDACGMALRLARGIDRRPLDPVEMIREVVQAGEALSLESTRRFWKEELSVASSLIDRDGYGDWEAKGRISSAERAREEVARRLSAAADPPLGGAGGSGIERIMLGEARRAGLSSLPAT
ncbi:MAG: hypothetical protein FJY88_09360 [Candidatus Eisenbacteria bacterium]|nr:hypothetical protein [Candidatus Eisenbacteria bacterium]